MFVSAVDMTIVNVALPAISEELNAGVSELQWVLDGFLVAFAGLLLIGSGMADRFGRKRVFLSPPALSLIAVMYPPEEREGALSVWVVVAAPVWSWGRCWAAC